MMRTSSSFAGKRVDRENECCYNNKAIYEPLAQSVEHLTFNQGVRGSNPRWLTKYRKYKPCRFGLFPLWYIWNLRYQGFPLVGLQSNTTQGTNKAPASAPKRTCGGFLLHLGSVIAHQLLERLVQAGGG